MDVYLYGMILITNSFLLQGSYPEPDTYAEIKERFSLPGGETGTAATILANLGCKIIMDGTYAGKYTYQKLVDFYKDKTVDISKLYFDETYDGLEDFVIIDKSTRTPFGSFGDFYSNGLKRWHEPDTEDILSAKVVGLDPWFEEQSRKVAKLCRVHHIPYVTIDCPYDDEVHRDSSVNVLSNEFISMRYPNMDREDLFQRYIESSNGLVIFTLGSKDILYGRKGYLENSQPKHFTPYHVDVVSTLGAGDSFKAGCIYALLQNMEDDEIVRFAAATAACACTAFPLPLNPPSLDQIQALMNS